MGIEPINIFREKIFAHYLAQAHNPYCRKAPTTNPVSPSISTAYNLTRMFNILLCSDLRYVPLPM